MQAATAVWIGIDVAKASVDAAVHLEHSAAPAATFSRTQKGVGQLLAWAREHVPADAPLRALMEATGRYSLEVIAWLLAAEASLAPACVNPLQAKRFAQSLGTRNKTDRVDARVLARMGAERKPAAYQPPTPARAALRDLVRERRALVDERTALNNRIGEGTDSAIVRRERDRLLGNLKRAIQRMDKAIAEAVAADAQLRRDVARLCTIPGVGMVLSLIHI